MGTALSISEIPDPDMGSAVVEYVSSIAFEKTSDVGSFLRRLLRPDEAARRAAQVVEPWKTSKKEDILIDTLNEASIVIFLEHTAKLEELSAVDEAIDKSRWRNLPYWQHSIWLPLKGRKLAPIVAQVSGWPCLVGTASGLLDDLKDIAAISPKTLAEKPKSFDLMLSDPKTYFAQSTNALSEDETLCWIWHAYNFGAEQAIARSMPLWQAG
jgi:hypothetical protein